MIDPKLLVVKPVGELERIANPLLGDLLYYDGSANLKRSSLEGFRSLISSGIKGEATPTTIPTPWASGQPDLYEKYDVKTAGTYTNFKDSSNAAIVISTADLTNNFVQIWVKNGVSQKVLSSKPIATSAEDPEARTALKSFLNTENKTETLIRNFLISDNSSSNYNILGVQNSYGRYLNVNNTNTGYSAAGEYYNVWMNIPVKANGISRIDLSIIPYGAPNGETDKSNLVGVKNGVATALTSWNGTIPTTLQNYSIDVSNYDTVSLGLYVRDSSSVSNTQTVKFYKVEGGTTKIDAVKEYVDSKTTGLSMWMNVKNEGAKGDGVTDDTAAINAAIVKLNNLGGGTLYFPKGTYIVSQITIPNVVNWNTIHLLGEFPPAQRFGTITARPQYPPNYTNPNGAIIKSNSDTVNAVIYGAPGTSYQQFNTAYLFLQNLTVRTSKENPNTDCVNAYYLFQLQCLNVVLDTGVYNVDAIEPINVKSGLVTPKNQNCALTYLQNMSISGFYHGIRVFEHTNGDSLQIQSCKNALTFEFADHSSYFGRCCFQRNTNQINVVGEHLFVIDQLNMEYAGPGQTTPTNVWQSTQWEINDPQNLGIGNITYANVKGAVGKVTTWRMNGASKVICKRVGAENRTTATIPSP